MKPPCEPVRLPKPAALPAALPLLFALGLALGGCAAQGTFPSLARRAQEDVPGRVGGTVPPAPPAPQVTLPAPPVPGQSASPAELRSAAAAAHERFAAQRASAEALTAAARGAAPGSEAWATATVALAGLTAEHDALVGVQADLDAIDIRQRIDGGDGGAIAAVRDQVTAWVADEDAVLADFNGRLQAGPAARQP